MNADQKQAVYDELQIILETLPKGVMTQDPDDIYSKDWIEANNQCLSKVVDFIQQRALTYLEQTKKSDTTPAKSKSRYWVRFISGYYKDEGCSHPDFPSWIVSDIKDRRLFLPHVTQDGQPKTDCIIAALIDAMTEEELWQRVKQFFPDYEMQSIETKTKNWMPSEVDYPWDGIKPHCKP